MVWNTAGIIVLPVIIFMGSTGESLSLVSQPPTNKLLQPCPSSLFFNLLARMRLSGRIQQSSSLCLTSPFRSGSTSFSTTPSSSRYTKKAARWKRMMSAERQRTPISSTMTKRKQISRDPCPALHPPPHLSPFPHLSFASHTRRYDK